MKENEKEKPTELSKIAGRNLVILRKKFHITQEKLAELIGISSTHLSNIERGYCGASLKLIGQILKALPITPNDLFIEKSKKTSTNDLTSILKYNLESFGFNLYMELTDYIKSQKYENASEDYGNYHIPPKKRNPKEMVADPGKKK